MFTSKSHVFKLLWLYFRRKVNEKGTICFFRSRLNFFFIHFFFNHDISDWNLMFRTIFPTMTFLKKKWHFSKKKVMVVKNHINWKSDKCSSTMTLRKKNVMADKNEKLVTIWQILAQTWRFWPNVGKIIRYVIFCSWN